MSRLPLPFIPMFSWKNTFEWTIERIGLHIFADLIFNSNQYGSRGETLPWYFTGNISLEKNIKDIVTLLAEVKNYTSMVYYNVENFAEPPFGVNLGVKIRF